jgi:hypothetical protein
MTAVAVAAVVVAVAAAIITTITITTVMAAEDRLSSSMQAGAWRSVPLEAAQRVHTLELGARTALFCGRTQRLSELNDTAALAWRALVESGSCVAVAARLRQGGAAADESEAFAQSIVREWLRLGYVTLADGQSRDPSVSFDIGVGPIAAHMRFFGTSDHRAARDVFDHLAHQGSSQLIQIDVVGIDDEDLVLVDGASEGLATRAETVPRLKAILTGRYCAAVGEGFLAHAALVSAREKRVLLTGIPGAGKTTLTLALCAAGFAYGADDIVHIKGDGRAEGAPFAAAVKAGAWPLLARAYPELAELPTHLRGDGQFVRYLTPRRLEEGGARPIDAVFVLERHAGTSAELTPIEPREAFCTLLESGYAERRSVDGVTLEALARDLSRAVCARLTYCSVDDAVKLLQKTVYD